MAHFILIHGGRMRASTWNRAVGKKAYPEGVQLGPQVWSEVASRLRQQGHHVETPALGDEHQYGLSDHCAQVLHCMEESPTEQFILVGHSYGGMVVSSVASRVPNKIKELFYIDAAVPQNGQSLFDVLASGGLDPHSIISGNPKAYTEKALIDDKLLDPLQKHYLRCTKSNFNPATEKLQKKIKNNPDHWVFKALDTGHIPMATAIDPLMQFLSGV
jgi:pimeloyl-ACP methyl ester carboxylesterase